MNIQCINLWNCAILLKSVFYKMEIFGILIHLHLNNIHSILNPSTNTAFRRYLLEEPDMKKILASLEDVYDSAKHHAADNLERAAALYNGKMHE